MTRRRTVVMLAGACAVVVAALTSLAGIPGLWFKVVVSAGAALTAYVGGLLKSRGNDALEQRRDRDVLYLRGRKAPLVRDVNDPVSIGVHSAPRLSGLGRVPSHVPRDVTPQLHEALTASGFVLVTGDAAVGKTRTAYEAMRDVLPGHVFFAPAAADDVAASIAAAREEPDCVLWLDNLERYLGADAVTSRRITHLLAGEGHHRVVLATLRAVEESRLMGLAESLPGGQLVRDGQAVLEQVDCRIVIERLFSEAERDHAAALAIDDVRLANALKSSGMFGVAEYLSSGPQLHVEWDDAWARGAHPRAAALIAAAVDCRRAGFAALLPQALLEELHQDYLERRGGALLRPEPLADAWTWATAMRDSGNSLLWSGGEAQGYDVFDYLVDVRARDAAAQHVPENTVRAALRFASAADATVIATTAWDQRRPGLAEAGFLTAYTVALHADGPDAPATLASRCDLAATLHALGKLPQAEAEYRAILAGQTAVLGADHPDTLTSRNNFAAVLHEQLKMDETETEIRAVLDIRTKVLGPQHPSTLLTRNNLGVLLKDTGRLAEAVAELEEVVRLCILVLGEDHRSTVVTRDNLDKVRRKLSAE
jgi:hypothetical protein